MAMFKVVMLFLVLLHIFPIICFGESTECTRVYDQGGASAVFQSDECPDWVPFTRFSEDEVMDCFYSTTLGRRRDQEDRISCNLNMKIPFPGNNGTHEELRVGVVAVFDGHNGSEASEMASKLFLDFFYLNSVFGSYKLQEEQIMVSGEQNIQPWSSKGSMSADHHKSRHLGVLKDALLKTIQDIDTVFTEEASSYGSASGSTAVILLIVDKQILVANVGDSKAILCTEKTRLRHDAGTSTTYLTAIELTRDHNALQVEERARIEAAGGVFVDRKIPLLNGHFPMTRAIGDVPLKKFGIISVPEVTDWRPLGAEDDYLVVSSAGIFQSMSPQDVCDVIHNNDTACDFTYGFPTNGFDRVKAAGCISYTAYSEGSLDNLSVVVVPLRSPVFSPSLCGPGLTDISCFVPKDYGRESI